MAMWVCALFFGTFVNAATLKTKVSPVQKVIELLDDLSGKVKGDLQKEGYLMDEYTKWCDSESNEKEDAIAEAGRTIDELKATIEESSGLQSSCKCNTKYFFLAKSWTTFGIVWPN